VPSYDVTVVGAGPAGSVAAYEMAIAGFRTLLLEKFPLPRDKPCGGAVMYRGLRLLRGEMPRRLVERPIYGLRFTLPDGNKAEFVSHKLLGVTTNRATFDEFLARRAERTGAELLENVRVVGVKTTSDVAYVQAEDERVFESQFVIGADGVNSIVSRSVGLRPERKDLTRIGLGMESDVYVGESKVLEAFRGNPTVLEIRPVEGRVSYGWIFPKREHLGIGIAGAGVHMHPLRPIFDRFVETLEGELGFSLPVEKRRTYFLGADGLLHANVKDRVMLVGDAAGFVDPMMGEGIAYAMRSSIHATRVLKTALTSGHYDAEFLSRYHGLCEREFGANFRMASRVGLRGTGFAESVLTKASRLDFASEIMARVARGEMGYSDIPVVALAMLPRRIPRLIRDYLLSVTSSAKPRKNRT